MDNPPPLTPNKIQRLMYLAEDKSFNTYKSGTYEVGLSSAPKEQTQARRSSAYDSSSGLLDLDRYEGFGESRTGSISLSKSTAFHPGEMTGRSTGAEDMSKIFFGPVPTFNEYGRHSSSDLHDYEKKLTQQSNDVQEIMRQSIASGYSYHSRRDLTADEASLVLREAPLPVPQSQINMHLKDIMPETDPIEMSMGAYFKNRCQQFDDVLPRTDSPQYEVSSMGMSMAEDFPSLNQTKDIPKKEPNNLFQMDMTLDCVPVRQPRVGKVSEKPVDNNTFAPISPAKENKQLMGPPASTNRPYAAKQTFLLDPSRQHLSNSLRPVHNDSCKSEEYDSLSLSKIANILEKESDVSVATMMKHMKGQHGVTKHPLTELNMNLQENRTRIQEIQVVHLKDTRKSVTASSAGTVNTVIDMGKISNQENDQELPYVVVTQPTGHKNEFDMDSDVKTESRGTRSKSPSSKSRSTMSTVQENLGCASFKSGDSPMQPCKGEIPTHVLSPNIEYKELDKSVDWDEVMQMKGRLNSEGLAKEPWAEIQTRPVKGFVGVGTPATLSIKSLSEIWLTARLDFPPHKDITVDLPRFPLVLAPKSCEHCTFQVTSNIEMTSNLNFTLCLNDSSVDREVKIEGTIEIDFQMPTIQAIAADGVNKVSFPPIQEGKSLTRSLVLISDCSKDLQLELSVKKGGSLFTINNVQEIKKSDITKELIDHVADGKQKYKTKGLNKQLCRLTSGNALKVALTFSTPKMANLNLNDTVATFNGCLDVNLIGINAMLKKIDLVASVGRPKLVVNIFGKQSLTGKLQLTNEVTDIIVTNTGSIAGTWIVKFKDFPASDCPFKVSVNQLEIDPGQSVNLKLAFVRPEDSLTHGTLIFQEIPIGTETLLELIAGKDKSKAFPVKTSCSELSWVRPGRKEISLKNTTDKKLHIKCRIKGEGFYIDFTNSGGSSGVNSNIHVTMNANECRPLPVVFRPTTNQPCKAYLYMAYEKETEISRKVTLYGCASGESLRWAGLATYGDTALVRAVARKPVHLQLGNKSSSPVFISARVHFNLQYVSVVATSRLEGARRIIQGKGATTLTLHVDWARVEKRARAAADSAATALATVTVLTGAEFTRRRILKVLKQGSEELDISSLPAHLQPLAGRFELEDPHLDELLKEFDEAKTSLDELVGGIHELTAQIDLSQDFSEDNTILIMDDTVVDHHTLCE